MTAPLQLETSTRSVSARRRRRLLRWSAGVMAVMAALLFFLPSIVALPVFRERLLATVFPGLTVRVEVEGLSLGWFAPIRASGIRLESQENAPYPAALEIQEVVGDRSLWQVLTGDHLGGYRVVQPEVFVQFNQEGSNWGRLVAALHGAPNIERTIELEIVDAKIMLQGPSSTDPWSLDRLGTRVRFSPATENPYGVPLIEGSALTLLDRAELTPELCDDLLKYIVPSFAGVARADGHISLRADEYFWPIGKPNDARMSGQMVLHAVNMAPGEVADSFTGLLDGLNLPRSFKVAQDDAVLFRIEEGRVHHQNFAFGLIDLNPDRLVRTHGSVGFDQSLELYVDIPLVGSGYLPEGPLREALGQTDVTIKVTGYFDSATAQLQLPAGADFSPALEGLSNLLDRWNDRPRRGQRPLPTLFNRRLLAPAN